MRCGEGGVVLFSLVTSDRSWLKAESGEDLGIRTSILDVRIRFFTERVGVQALAQVPQGSSHSPKPVSV